MPKQFLHIGQQPIAAFRVQADQQHTSMGARAVAADIGEIQIGSNEKSVGLLSSIPDHFIRLAGQLFRGHGINVMPVLAQQGGQFSRQILVQLDAHGSNRQEGFRGGEGDIIGAAAAAKAMTACTSAAFNEG